MLNQKILEIRLQIYLIEYEKDSLKNDRNAGELGRLNGETVKVAGIPVAPQPMYRCLRWALLNSCKGDSALALNDNVWPDQLN